MRRLYQQHCGLAHALDLVGDRWTLLIVRDLLAGPRRYTDLASSLVTVASNLLADRLRQLEADGLVRRTRLPAPAESLVVYELTALGESLGESLEALARWGMRTLPVTTEGRAFRASWLVLALRARFRSDEAAGVREAYEFRIGRDVVHLRVADGTAEAGLGSANSPAVVVDADADTFLALVAGAIGPDEAVRRGASIHGDPAALARMARILPPPPTA
jgi:DNA-binding HxlR family transcriptional regulator